MGLEAETFQRARTLASDHRASETRPTSKEDIALLLSIPFQISAEQIGPAFTTDLKARILAIRVERSEEALRPLSDMFEQLDETQFTSGLDVIENALFGKLSKAAGGRIDALKALVVDTLTKAGLLRPITTLFQDLEVDLDGGNLTGLISDLICLSRAVIKRPDILILDSRLAYVDEGLRPDMRQRIRRLLPETTLIYLEAEFETEEALDKVYELIKGRLPSSEESVAEREDSAASADLQEKARTLKSARIFSGLHRKQLRLLAFGSQWFTAKEGKYVFRANDKPTDGAYLIIEGTAGLYGRDEDGADKRVAEAGPGTLIGELGLISDEPRRLDFKADTDIRALRLGAEEFLDVVEHDAATSFKLLQVVTSYLSAPPVAPQVEPD